MIDILAEVRRTALLRVLYLPHAIRQMSRPGRMITPSDVEAAISQGRLVEDYPEDVRGHSCLLLGFGTDSRAVHVVCAPKVDYLSIITAYRPDPAQWSPDFMKRLR
jgi:hypothetical protein